MIRARQYGLPDTIILIIGTSKKIYPNFGELHENGPGTNMA